MTTALSSYPWNTSPDMYESQWRAFMKHARATGVIKEDPNDPEKLNELEVYADSTGMQVKIKTGIAFLRGVFAPLAALTTEAIQASHATLDRIDRVVLKLDTTNRTVTVEVVTGTPAGSPVAPTLTNTSSIHYVKLAQVSVIHAVTTIAADKVTDERDWSSTNLIVIPIIVGDGVQTLTTGTKGYVGVPANCTPYAWAIFGDASGSAVVDIHSCTYSGFPTTATIFGVSEKPTLSSAKKARNVNLTTKTPLTFGDILEAQVDSATTVKQVTVLLYCVKA